MLCFNFLYYVPRNTHGVIVKQASTAVNTFCKGYPESLQIRFSCLVLPRKNARKKDSHFGKPIGTDMPATAQRIGRQSIVASGQRTH